MKKNIALNIKRHLLAAISELTGILYIERDHFSREEYDLIKKEVGVLIGEIQVNLLDFIYSEYPEIDDILTHGENNDEGQRS
jgi:hypothetical protein